MTATAACYTPQGSVYAMSVGQTTAYNGFNISESFNNRLQPSEIVAGSALDVTYNFVDPVSGKNAGHVYGSTNKLNSSRSQSFTYDQVNRIATAATSATTGSYCWGYQFGYDAWGNLNSQAAQTGYSGCTQFNPAASTADGNNHLPALSYDTSGNTQNDGSYSYTWDGESQLKTAGGVTYSYDGDGRRAAKVGSKLYWYGSGGEILAETDAAGNTQNEYIFFGGRRVAQVPASGSALYYAEDLLGSSRVIVQANGTLCYDADFTPFGGERAYVATCAQNYKFEGKERDTETQNDDFGARYYSWRWGRWLSSDWSAVPVPVPYANLTNPQTLNLYSMTADDPESFADLDGHNWNVAGQPGSPCGCDAAANAMARDIGDFLSYWGSVTWDVIQQDATAVGNAVESGVDSLEKAGCCAGAMAGPDPIPGLNQIFSQDSQAGGQNAQPAPPSQANQGAPTQPQPSGGNDLNRSSSTERTGKQGQNTTTTISDSAGSTTYKTTPGKTGGQSTIVVRKDDTGKTVYVKQEARTNNRDFTKPPDHVHYKKPIDKEVR